MPGGPAVVGLVGCGRWGRNVLRDLCTLGCEVHVVDTRPDGRRRASGATSVVDDLSSLGPCDGYVVATPATTHAAVVGTLLERDRPVFVEKPFTTDAAVAAALAEAGDGRVFVMEKWRYHPAVPVLRSLARSGALGRVVEVRTRRWSGSRSQADVGPEWTLAPHDLSVLDEVVGPLGEVVAAAAELGDGAVVRLRATVEAGAPCHVDVWDAAPSPERTVVVVGSDATASWSSADGGVVVVEGAGAASPGRRPLPRSEPPLLAELREFVEHLRGGPPPRVPAGSGARTVALVEQALRLAGVAVPSEVEA